METPRDLLTSSTWIELNSRALKANIDLFKTLIGPRCSLMAVVKANAYGHGLGQIASCAAQNGADWLGVFTIAEGLALRDFGIDRPILVLGPPETHLLSRAIAAELRLTVSTLAVAEAIAAQKRPVNLHLKVETGTNRQGLKSEQFPELLTILSSGPYRIEGVYTHFADIEDTTDHVFAMQQIDRFEAALETLRGLGIEPSIPHSACSAAAILFPRTHFGMVRVGISLYGLWPSRETRVSAQSLGRSPITLEPVMTWKTRISQIKELEEGEYVGYGRTYRATRKSRIAVIPIGYSDGYDRRLSNTSHVLIGGARAPVRGRVCMNLTMVDVTDIPAAQAGDEVVLLGRQQDETITADDLAKWAGTINYEVVTRLAPSIPRILA